MPDGMQYDPIQGQGQGRQPFRFGNHSIFKSYVLCHLQWELATDHGAVFKFDWVGFLTSVLVSVSRDFELGRNVSYEESTVSPVRG